MLMGQLSPRSDAAAVRTTPRARLDLYGRSDTTRIKSTTFRSASSKYFHTQTPQFLDMTDLCRLSDPRMEHLNEMQKWRDADIKGKRKREYIAGVLGRN